MGGASGKRLRSLCLPSLGDEPQLAECGAGACLSGPLSLMLSQHGLGSLLLRMVEPRRWRLAF